MATLTTPGVGANLDVKTIVSQLMSVERQSVTSLDKKEASFNTKLSSYGAIKSALFSFQKTAQDLNLSSAFNAIKASVADTTILSAATSGTPATGSHDIEVKNLALAQKLSSTPFPGSTSVVGEGTLTITLGKYSDPGSPPVTFTANEKKAAKTITIDSTNRTLDGIRDAINSAGAGVTASIINDGSGYRLALASNETGAENAMKITVTESGGAGLAQLAYDASAGGVSNLTENVAARDAKIVVNNITITKPSNTITDAIQGVTLTLAKESAVGTTTKLTLARDTTGTRTAIEAFVKAYNDVQKKIAEVTAVDPNTKKGSVLTGDATARSVQSMLRNAMATPIAGAQAGLSVLSDAGISFQKDGTLSIDSSKLDKALASTSKDISKLFLTSESGTIGFGSRLNTLVSSMIFGDRGVLNSRMAGINESIKNIGTQRNTINTRLADVEKRYYAQFTALDTMIASMTKTSTFLQQQLQNLPKSE